ncbi:MAG TPA: transcriptional regulator [Treponema sp.]|nr:transcriptional regulator [Treponema sp.]
MEYSVQKVLSLISHIHSVSAEFTNRRLAEKNLISSHGFILFQLAQNETMSMTQLAACINRDKSTTTVLVKKLLAEDLVKITTSSKDSRVRLISLTSKGKKYKDLTSSISEDLLTVCYKGFSKEEKQKLLSLLNKVNENIEDSLKK